MIDRYSDTWSTIAQHAEDRLQKLRDRLEAPGLDQPTTEGLRGRIMELRDLLDLAEGKRIIE